ncbi:hypothetical protein Tco_0113061, partial [Tanacetum coccineum]
EASEDLENFGDERMELRLDVVKDRLDDYWFIDTINDEDDLNGIVDYLELDSHDDFIDIKNEACQERRCKLLGMTYKEPPPIIIEKVEVTRYTIRPEESYMKFRVLEIEEMPITSSNIATVRAELMKETDTTGSVQRET